MLKLDLFEIEVESLNIFKDTLLRVRIKLFIDYTGSALKNYLQLLMKSGHGQNRSNLLCIVVYSQFLQ